MTGKTVVVLAGGKGTRLAGLFPDLPKPLVPIAGQPFLHWLITWLKRQGLSDFVFSLGYRGDQIEAWLAASPTMKETSWRIFREPEPLGTGGGVRATLHLCNDNVIITNGDSLILTPLQHALANFENPALDGMLLGVPMEDASRYGTLSVDANSNLAGFREKQPGAGLINSGVYFFRKRNLAAFPEGKNLSMEYDVIPKLIADKKQLRVLNAEAGAPFIDIGTPETVAQGDAFIAKYF